MNNFTKEEIKESLEYTWRKSSLKWILILWAVIAVLMTLPMLVLGIGNMENFIFTAQIWLLVMAIYTAILLPFILYYFYKMRYLVKHYNEFSAHEVVLDNPSTSHLYRGAVYYTVTVNDEDAMREVDTNPYFASGIAAFSLNEYNNKRVVGLYDGNADKFYIIKRVGK